MTGLKIALQSGAMKSATMQLFEDAFLRILQKNTASFDGLIKFGGLVVQVRFMKSSNVPNQVVSGEFHCGITGQDVIYQAGMEKEIYEVAELCLARKTNQSARVVLAGMSGAEFKGAVTVYVDREYSRLAKELIQSSTNVSAELKVQDGTSEERVRRHNDFAIIATETGFSLSANDLEIIQVLMESHMVLFVNKELCALHGGEFALVEDVGLLLKGVLMARPRVLLKMNIPDDSNLETVLSFLPSLASPTEMILKSRGHALEAVVFADKAAELIPKLKRS